MKALETLRTTVTLDSDTLHRAREFSQSRGISFRQGLNELVRLGLTAQAEPRERETFDFNPLHLGPLRTGMSYDNIEELLEAAEGPLHR